MEKKKNPALIAIIVILVLLIIAGGVFAYLYFCTDILKTDRQAFAKYVMQIGDKESDSSTTLQTYENKKLTMPYTNNGSFTAITNAQSNSLSGTDAQIMSQMLSYGNNTNITFSGRVDNQNKKNEQDISINYGNSVNLPFKFKQDGDIYGVQADFVSPNYISIENNNLKDLFTKLGATDVSEIPNKLEIQEIQSLKFTEEELEYIKENYVLPIFEGFSEEKFSKVENSDGSISYVLTATASEIQDVEISLLEKLKADTTMLNRINEIIAEVSGDNSNAITPEDIQSIIDNGEDLMTSEVEDMELEISITQKDGKTNKLEISTNGLIIEMLFNQTDSDISTTVSIKLMNVLNISAEIKYANVNTDAVTESMIVNMNVTGVMDTKYSYTNTVNFDSSINIEGFGSNNVVLNNYQGVQIENFITQVAMAIAQKNSEQMQQIQFPEELGNPMVMWIAGPGLAMSIYNQANINDSLESQVPNSEEIGNGGDMSSMLSDSENFIN